jgi:hypothetical protein
VLDQVCHDLQAPCLALAQTVAEFFLVGTAVRHVREYDGANDGLFFEAPGADDGEDQTLVLEDHELVETQRRELLVQEAEAGRGSVLAAVRVADAGHLAFVCELTLGLVVHPA